MFRGNKIKKRGRNLTLKSNRSLFYHNALEIKSYLHFNTFKYLGRVFFYFGGVLRLYNVLF